MKNVRLLSLLLFAILLTGTRAAPAGALPRAAAAPARVLVDYCFTTPDYACKFETVGPNVTFTFHPLGGTAGGNLALVFVREVATGTYPGYTMARNAAGDFTFTRAIANGLTISVYFTYQVGPGGPQRNTAAAPHAYVVGSDCTVAASNLPPTVSLTAPAAGTFAAPATIVLSATAADADGTVRKVEFFAGTTLLGQALAPPYTYTWAGVPGDSYDLTAKATDNGNASTTTPPVRVLVQSADGYCATRPDYAYSAVTAGPTVTFTFHPLGATAGGNLALVFVREVATGTYPGYPMARNAAGDFTFAKPIASGVVVSIYFTYEVGPGGPQQTSLAAPHTYVVGTSCLLAAPSATTATARALALAVAPNPSQSVATVRFVAPQATPYEVALYDLKGARIQVVGAGRVVGGQAVALALPTAGLAGGLYLVRLVTNQGVATQRLAVGR